MPKSKKKGFSNPLTEMKFPIIFEGGKPKAFIIDIEKYRELELFLDNLINLREEAEDEVILDSSVLEKLVAKAKEEAVSREKVAWEQDLDEL